MMILIIICIRISKLPSIPQSNNIIIISSYIKGISGTTL